jgi:hypothetical protein
MSSGNKNGRQYAHSKHLYELLLVHARTILQVVFVTAHVFVSSVAHRQHHGSGGD